MSETTFEATSPGPRSTETQTTGHSRVDAALAALDDLRDAPVHEHVAVLERAHAELRVVLTEPSDPAADERA